jgi:sn-glycerol 3-phosphate transport system permease protein
MRKSPPVLPYLLVAPTFLFVCTFTIVPLASAILGSLFRYQLNIPRFQIPQWHGVGNYIRLFSDAGFRGIIGNTVLYVVVLVPATIIAALALSLLVWGKIRGKEFFRLVFFHPSVLPMVSAATIWLFFFTPDYGILNQVLHFFGYTGPQNWTGNPRMALWTLVIVAFWKQAGFSMLFILAGLQNIDRSVLEAARLDGSTGPGFLMNIVLPLIRRQILFVNTITIIGAFQTVDHVFVLTKGGPSERSNLLLYQLWQVRFEQLDLGRAAAITVILVAVLLALTTANFMTSERHER